MALTPEERAEPASNLSEQRAVSESFVRQLEQRVADLARQRAALHNILEAASTPAALPVVLRQSLQGVLLAARGDAGFIHLREKSSGSMHLVAEQGISEVVRASISHVSAQDGLVAWVARKGQPLLIPNMRADARTVYLTASEELTAYAGVPVSRGARVWGTLSVLGKDPAQFGEEEIALLVAIGEEIGMVVENARLRRQTEQLLVVEERSRLARELHDSVTQSLYSLTLFAEAGRRTAEAEGSEAAARYFSQIGETGQQALKEMRLLVHKLRPSLVAEAGLVRALQHRLNSVEGRAGVTHQLAVEGSMALSPALEDTVYQIAQEALNNALKHALASEVSVTLTMLEKQQVELVVVDNGRGFEPGAAGDSGGMGLTSMLERAQMSGGSLTIHSRAGEGTTVTARLQDSAPPAFGVEDLP